MFPPVRTFILDPDRWWSRDGTPTLEVGELLDEDQYALSALVDGEAGAVTRFASPSVEVEIDLGAEQDVNMLGLFTHNLDPTLLISVVVDGDVLPRTFGVEYPHCWIDLRAFVAVATTVRVRIYGNSKPISLGEIVIGDADLFNGVIELPLPEQMTVHATRARTDYQVLQEMGPGAISRALRMRLQVGIADQLRLTGIWDRVRTAGDRLIVVPSSRRNAIWMLDPPAVRMYEHERALSHAVVQIDALESAPGVV